MKKITRIVVIALALMMTATFQIPVNASEEYVAKFTKLSNGIYGEICYLTPNRVTIWFNNMKEGSNHVKVQIRNYKGKVIKTHYNGIYLYVSFSLSKNKLYSYRIRGVYPWYKPCTKWSNSVYFTTAKYEVTQVGNREKFKIKTPKVAGIKNYKIYVSLKKNGGWKKIKTVTAGKEVIISKFKGKALKKKQNYYYKIIPNKGCFHIGGIRFR